MRYALTVAAALAVGGLLASTAAQAELLYYPGGPVKQGNMCQRSTQGDDQFGYWAPCPEPAKPAKVAKRTKKMKT
jgi:hypothetical protein